MFSPDDCFGCSDNDGQCDAYPKKLNIIPCPCGTCLIKTMCEHICELYVNYFNFLDWCEEEGWMSK